MGTDAEKITFPHRRCSADKIAYNIMPPSGTADGAPSTQPRYVFDDPASFEGPFDSETHPPSSRVDFDSESFLPSSRLDGTFDSESYLSFSGPSVQSSPSGAPRLPVPSPSYPRLDNLVPAASAAACGDESQFLLLMLLAQVCALNDPTPNSFAAHVLELHSRGVLGRDAIAFLVRRGIVVLPDSPARGGGNPVPPPPILLSRFRREFEVLSAVGRGGFGTVHAVRSRTDGGVYAIKKIVVRASGTGQPPDLEGLLREVQCLAQCDHPNVVRYHATWMEPGWMAGDRAALGGEERIFGGKEMSTALAWAPPPQKVNRGAGADPALGLSAPADDREDDVEEVYLGDMGLTEAASTAAGGADKSLRQINHGKRKEISYKMEEGAVLAELSQASHEGSARRGATAPLPEAYYGVDVLSSGDRKEDGEELYLGDMGLTTAAAAVGVDDSLWKINGKGKKEEKAILTGLSLDPREGGTRRGAGGPAPEAYFTVSGDTRGDVDYDEDGSGENYDDDYSEWSNGQLSNPSESFSFEEEQESPGERQLMMWYGKNCESGSIGNGNSEVETEGRPAGPLVPYGNSAAASSADDDPFPTSATPSASATPFRYSICLYIQMQLCSKWTLADWIWDRNARAQQRDASPLPSAELRRAESVFVQLARGLAHVHSRGIIHRDLKPSNILCDVRQGEGGEPIFRIGDFGLSKLLSREDDDVVDAGGRRPPPLSAGGHTTGIGTASYASPEQTASGSYGPASDVFSLGMILMELFCVVGSGHERAAAFRGCRAGDALPTRLEEDLPDIARRVKECTYACAKKRPTALKLLEELEREGWGREGNSAASVLRAEEKLLRGRLEDLEVKVEDQKRTIDDRDEVIRRLKMQVSELSGNGVNSHALSDSVS